MASGRFGDGHVDLIVADSGDIDNGIKVRASLCSRTMVPGQFHRVGTIAAGAAPSAVVAGDFTGDGMLDLAVADSNSDVVSVLLNNGNGTFQAPRSYAVGNEPLALVAADFGNGDVDLAVANGSSDDISVLLGNGDGSFQPQLRFGAGTFPDRSWRPILAATGGLTSPPAIRSRATSPFCWAEATAPSRTR